jgi:hypothetical protein
MMRRAAHDASCCMPFAPLRVHVMIDCAAERRQRGAVRRAQAVRREAVRAYVRRVLRALHASRGAAGFDFAFGLLIVCLQQASVPKFYAPKRRFWKAERNVR